VTAGDERARIKRTFDEAVAGAERNDKGEVGLSGVTVMYWMNRV